MPSHSLLGLSLLMSAASAAPSMGGRLARPLTMRAGPDDCAATNNGQDYVADVGYYSDQDCTQKIGHECYYTYDSIVNDPSGSWGCNPGDLPDPTPYYAKLENTPYDQVQIIYTSDQSCPPDGPGSVFATLINNPSCVEFNLGGSAPGVTLYPKGGASVARRDTITPNEESIDELAKRDTSCSGFTIDSSEPSSSQSVQVSNIVDCTNGASSGCEITEGSQHTESVTTSYSATAGGGIEGLFEVSATFGQSYTSSSTTSIQEGYSVQQGQKGFLSAYSEATLFKGTYTGCKSGASSQPGEALVIKSKGFTYEVINTGA